MVRRQRSAACVILIMICCCLPACSGVQAPASSSETPQRSAPSSLPAATSIPQATIPPQWVILGGDLSAFDAKYGPAYREDAAAALYQSIRYQINLFVATDGQPGGQENLHDRVISIDTYPLEGVPDWDLQAVQQICKAFMPPDAKYLKDVAGPIKGDVLHLYVSQLLANVLPSRDFVISSADVHLKGKSVQPGLFTVGYNNFVTVSPKQFFECGLGVGIDYQAVG